MPIRPSTSRRTCTLAELVDWVVFGEVNCSLERKLSRPSDDFDLAKSDIKAALRDGHIQPLGYLPDGSVSRVGLKEIVAAVDSGQEDRLPRGPQDRSKRIPPEFWTFASIDWEKNRAKGARDEFVEIYCLMEEVRKTWPLENQSVSQFGMASDSPSAPSAGSFGTSAFSASAFSVAVPASDRIVNLDHNSADYKEAIASLDEIVGALGKSPNDLGSISAEDRVVVLSNLRHGLDLLKGPAIRIGHYKAFIQSSLTFIAGAAANGVIGDLAAKALGLWERLMGLLT